MKASRRFPIRFLCALLFIFTVFYALLLPIGAQGLPDTSGASAVILYSINADRILFAKDPDVLLYPSATVKLLSGLIFCESLAGRLDEPVTVSAAMLNGSSGRSFGLKVGDTLSVRDLLRIALCGSFNDAFYVLCHICSGSVESFVVKMEQRADQLGAVSASFSNPTGIDSEKMKMSARDVLAIARAASENELYISLTSTYSYTVSMNGGYIKNIENRNGLHDIYGEYFNENAFGFCTGMTDLGGYSVATMGKYGDAEYICIVMGADEGQEYELSNKMLSFASVSYSVMTLKERGDAVGSIPVELSDSKATLPLILADDITVLLSHESAVDDERIFELVLTKPSLKAPVDIGETVGYMVVRSGDELIACVPVITAQSAQKNSFLGAMEDMKAFLGGRVVAAAAIFAICAFTAAFIIYFIASKKKRRRPVYAKGRYR